MSLYRPYKADVYRAQVVELRTAGRTFKQIAKALGISYDTARAAFYRASPAPLCPTCRGTGRA